MTANYKATRAEQRQLWRFWLITLVVFMGIIWLFHAVLLPFVMAFIISYFLHPLVEKLDRRGVARGLAAFLVLLGFVLFIAAVVTLLTPLVKTQITLIIQSLPHQIDIVRNQWVPTIRRYATQLSPSDQTAIKGSVVDWSGKLLSFLGNAATDVLSNSMALFDIFTLLVITPLVSFYLLRDWNLLIAQIDSSLPRPWEPTIREEARKIDNTLAGYVRGQALVSICLGAFYAIALSVSGLQFGFTIGLVTGILTFVPMVGTITGFVISILLALGQAGDSSTQLLEVLGVFAAGQILENNFLIPRLIGERTGLHPVWVLFSLMAGGCVFGFVGVLISLPLAATAGVLVRFAHRQYLESRYFDATGRMNTLTIRRKKKAVIDVKN